MSKIVSIDTFKKNRREQRKAEVLSIVEREMNKIHDSNFDIAATKIIEYAELMGTVNAVPGRAKQIEDTVKETMRISRQAEQKKKKNSKE